MKHMAFLILFTLPSWSDAKPYSCSAVRFGDIPTEILEEFKIDPSLAEYQEVVVESPKAVKLACFGQELNDSPRLICVIGELIPGELKIAPTASVKDGSDLITLVVPIGKINYAIACGGDWAGINALEELSLPTQ